MEILKKKADEYVMAKLNEYEIDYSVLKDKDKKIKINIDKVKAHSNQIIELLKKIIDGRKRRRSKSRSKKRSKRRRSKKRSSKRRY